MKIVRVPFGSSQKTNFANARTSTLRERNSLSRADAPRVHFQSYRQNAFSEAKSRPSKFTRHSHLHGRAGVASLRGAGLGGSGRFRTLPCRTSSKSSLLSSENFIDKSKNEVKWASFDHRNSLSKSINDFKSSARVDKLFRRISTARGGLRPVNGPRQTGSKTVPTDSNFFKKTGSERVFHEIKRSSPFATGFKSVFDFTENQQRKSTMAKNFRTSVEKQMVQERAVDASFDSKWNRSDGAGLSSQIPGNPDLDSPAKKVNFNQSLKKQFVATKFKNFDFKNNWKKLFIEKEKKESASRRGSETPSRLNLSEVIFGSTSSKLNESGASSQISLNPPKNERISRSYFSTKKPKGSATKTDANLYQSNIDFSTGNDLKESLLILEEKSVPQQPKRNPKIELSKTQIGQRVICGMSNGKPKVCQDQALVSTFQVKNKPFLLLAVFDGHGRFGERLSKFVKDHTSQLFQKELVNSKLDSEGVQSALCRTVNLLHSRIVQISSKITSKTYIFISRKTEKI